MGRVGYVVFTVCLIAAQAHAQPMRQETVPASDLCQRAIARGTPTTHLPPNLLGAIGRVESGRIDLRDGNVKAWPWSINAEGRGYVFGTKAEAIAAVRTMQARNVTSVDVGCMQVNLMYHPTAFASLDDAFDPTLNVRYAAKFLGELFAATKDWNLAAGFYHSKTPDLALSYQRKVMAQLPGAARVQAVSIEQVSLTNAWTATLGAPQPQPAKPSLVVQNTPQPTQRVRPHPLMLASRH